MLVATILLIISKTHLTLAKVEVCFEIPFDNATIMQDLQCCRDDIFSFL